MRRASPRVTGPVIGQPVTPVDWFRRMPNGGTVYLSAEGHDRVMTADRLRGNREPRLTS